jgi:hypothetical protein
LDHKSREEWATANINAIGRTSFPDDDEVTWKILAFQHDPATSEVEAEATPATVGYPRFKFILEFSDPGNPKDTDCYALEGEEWTLLFSVDPEADGDAPEANNASKSGCAGITFRAVR